VSLSSSKRRALTAAAVVLLALFVVRPGVSHLKARIANSIGNALGRRVEIGSVHLRFLPPGFDLQNMVISEDPAFGAEPMLRAPEVTATVRITSMLRGRLDIARLELTEPSVNLVRTQDGRWNWAALLERAARTPLAPTSKSKTEARPGFPYVEASSGRINFKFGPEKKPYALLNADFALWQESENVWGTRLKAAPLRTDMSLSDTGTLQMSGTWQRSETLRETPLQFTFQWERGQLGQLTKLVSGADKGWRGEVLLQAILSGKPSALKVAADTSVQNFHRYDIASSEGLRLMTHCDATYGSIEGMIRNIVCSSPVGDGFITLRGDAGLPAGHQIDLALNIENVPVSAAVQLVRRAKRDLPTDLLSTGIMHGDFAVKQSAASPLGPEFQGGGMITDLRLRSADTKIEFAPRTIPFLLADHAVHARSGVTTDRTPDASVLAIPDELHVEFGPFPVALGRSTPAQAQGWMARSGYGIIVRGGGEVSHTLHLAGLLGLPAIKADVDGAAQIDLHITGAWARSVSETSSGFSLPEITGTVQLHNVRVTARGMQKPIEVSSAQLFLTHDGVRVEKLIADAAAARWTGSLALPRGCGTPALCLIRFNLTTDEVGLSDLYESLGSPREKRPWYQLLSTPQSQAPSFLDSLRASGKINAGSLLIHGLTATRVSSALDLDHGKLTISNLSADFLGGEYRGDWHADFTASAPVYAGTGTMTGISLQQIADAMHDPWVSGKASGTYQVIASGSDSAAFWQSVEGELQFDLRDSVLPHILLVNDVGPLRVDRWQGSARIARRRIEVEKGKLVSPSGAYQISGAATFGRELDFNIQRSQNSKPGASSLTYDVTGTVGDPRVLVVPAPETQAQLKP
jgi:AsmA family/AsmA-like C-terminal region